MDDKEFRNWLQKQQDSEDEEKQKVAKRLRGHLDAFKALFGSHLTVTELEAICDTSMTDREWSEAIEAAIKKKADQKAK